MEGTVRKTVVISAVSIRKGGTLTILRQWLEEWSAMAGQYRVIALVHDRNLCDFPGIEYIEMPWCTKNWVFRLWAEYVTMYRISLDLEKQDGQTVWKWISMHDTTPRVKALHRQVYCQTSFPFMKPSLKDFRFDPKIPLFTMFTRWVYKINSKQNECMIVQQNWFREALSGLIGYPMEKIKVMPPKPQPSLQPMPEAAGQELFPYPVFLYASTPDCHKNFETLCKAAVLLEKELGKDRFKVILTVKGNENRYARYLFSHWGDCSSIDFHGLMTKQELFATYAKAHCLVFPSRIETWGLPISEYMSANPNGRMILSDLPYAHETSAGGNAVFFDCRNPNELAGLMKSVIEEQ